MVDSQGHSGYERNVFSVLGENLIRWYNDDVIGYFSLLMSVRLVNPFLGYFSCIPLLYTHKRLTIISNENIWNSCKCQTTHGNWVECQQIISSYFTLILLSMLFPIQMRRSKWALISAFSEFDSQTIWPANAVPKFSSKYYQNQKNDAYVSVCLK